MFRRENGFYENGKITNYAVKYEIGKIDVEMDNLLQKTMKESTFLNRKRKENLLQQKHIK